VRGVGSSNLPVPTNPNPFELYGRPCLSGLFQLSNFPQSPRIPFDTCLWRENPYNRTTKAAPSGQRKTRLERRVHALDGLAQIVAADLNKDGHTDLVVGGPSGFVVYFGDGNGAFPTKVSSGQPYGNGQNIPGADSFVVADLNNDGYPDVIEVLPQNGFVFLNQGGTSFTTGQALPAADPLIGLAVADLDADGCLVETGINGRMEVAKGNCDGTFQQDSPIAAVGDQDPAVVVRDVDGDGIPDIVASAAYYETGASAAASGLPVDTPSPS
jgi:hypothetical protein